MSNQQKKADFVGPEDEAPRVIGPVAAFAVVAGSMLGVGIFLFPGKVAFEVNGVGVFFLLWLLGGVFALAGSVACGELGAMMPKAGGDYVFQREALGPSMAFASGWVLFAAIFCGSIAGMSVAVFNYQVSGLMGVDLARPITDGGFVSWAQLLAIALIVAITAVNHVGTRISALTMVVLTLAPIAAMTLLSVYVLGGAPEPVVALVPEKAGATSLSVSGIASGFLYLNFAFAGWINIIYVAGEVKNPGRNIPRSMILASLGVTGLYLLMCAAFISVLGFNGLSALGWTDAGTGMARALGSTFIANAVLVMIALAIVTSIHATVLASARVAFAMGEDGAFWRGAAVLSGPARVPRRALWIQAILATILVLSGTFEQIIQMTSIAMFVTGTLTVLSMFVLRRTRPEMERPYRATFYPLLPGLYICLSLFAIGASLWQALKSGGAQAYYPLIGICLFGFVFIGHFYYQKRMLQKKRS